jgi:hypothetical protein
MHRRRPACPEDPWRLQKAARWKAGMAALFFFYK